MKAAGKKRMEQLVELEEFMMQAYENAKIQKEKVKKWHDKKILKREFAEGQLVLLFNSRLKLFLGKLKSRWSGPFKITKVCLGGALELINEKDGERFLVNGQRVKHYFWRRKRGSGCASLEASWRMICSFFLS
ncbi:uncharacterized protein LOC111901650 [Lactuca sativa]|uniref:uncharacterized protein LOC111901650 n=1 Tax=Lactuca sativa TaxID=4236 RepID=UPI000CD8BD3B|nr:uncharacterized protein LOC111901650 [Lactuca sativa]